ncbi:MAG: DUF192 domain-containing protein [Acidobacteriota bacterium]
MRLGVLFCLALMLAACRGGPAAVEPVNSRTVRLPGGQSIRVEVVSTPQDMARGLMFRRSIAPDRGMLFIHDRPGYYRYYMFQCFIPLDIIWMDHDHRIVEISADTPPCKTAEQECPTYGGNERAQFVLELGGGMAAKYGLKPGDALEF